MSAWAQALQSPEHLLWALALLAAHGLVMARANTPTNRTPASRVAWVAVLALLPLLGIAAYLLLGETSIGRDRLRRLAQALAHTPPPAGDPAPAALSEALNPLFAQAASISGMKAVGGNRIELLGHPGASATEPTLDCDAAIAALVQDIHAARLHIHLSFYIWLDDANGGRVAEALCRAAERGVQCRVMVDALGSRAFIRGPRWAQLRASGVKTSAALDDLPRLGRWRVGRLDLRSHRKLVVIDNAIAYCGSQNCADPAFAVQARFAPWVDVLLRCEGPIARQAQFLFVTAWMAENAEPLHNLPTALPEPRRLASDAACLMFGTGPATPCANAMSDLFVAAMYSARQELIVTTPYFVPDEAILRALCAAPLRGVQTALVVPARNNSKLVAAASRSTFPELLASGVSLYEYPLGLLHSKTLTVDGKAALVGSANMDRRSLQLNFENNLLTVDPAAVSALRQRQRGYIHVSQPVQDGAVRAWPLHRRLVQNTLGMLAPLL